jgi:beta-glucosidase
MLRRHAPLFVTSLLLLLNAFCAAGLLRGQEAPQSDAVKPVPRDGGWMKRHEAISDRVKSGKVDLVFIGDSITQGWEGNGAKVWEQHYAKRNAANLGIGGDRTQHVIWRLDNGNFEGITPKLAVVMIGTNNSGSNKPAEIAAGVKAIVEQIRTKSPKTQILLLAIFPRGVDDSDPRRGTNTATNEIIAKLDDGKTVHFLDIGPAFLNDKAELTREIMPDLLHLSPKGYQLWAEAIEPHVARLMGEQE